ncbi:Coiled-coil domain-containing protein isoform 2 [Schistosoma japonicum]|nr:Coiled-coil domain-containing protein isoform 2 [Schistosoma japonicum]
MERRRKRGLIDFKKVIQKSNDMTEYVKHGRSFFGMLNQEIIQKVYNFWELHNRIIESRKTRITPPVRMHTLNRHVNEHNNSNDESVEKKTDDIDEDEVLNEEPEIYELMNNLISAGCDLKLPLTDKQQYSNDMKQSHDYVISSIEHQRCRRYKQWEMELQRPFTPKYFNICKPDFGKDLNSTQFSSTYELITSKDVKQMKSEHVLDSSRDIIFSQLCCVLWLMEQMYLLTNSEVDYKWRPISASWKLNYNDSSVESRKSPDQQSQPDQIWSHFIYDTSCKQMKMKPRNQNFGSTNSLNSLQSGTLSSEQRSTTPISSMRKSQSIKNLSKSNSVDVIEESSNQLLQFIEHCNDSLLINQKSFNQSMNITNTTATIRKSVQFLRKTNPMKQNENQWISSMNEIHKMSREMLSEMVQQIEIEMDKESLKESELRLTTRGQNSSRTVKKRPFSESHVVKESSKELTSNKFSSLVDNIHKQISMAIDEKAIELQDRLEFMKQVKPEICLTKYHNIPVDKYTHVAMQCMQRMSLYNKATGELAKKSTKKKQLATWYLDILTDLSDLKSGGKFTQVLSKLKFYALLSPSLFTVLSFTRVLCSLTLWEILSPTIAAAIDFVRMRVVDMSTEEYLDWLCQMHPKIKEYITKPIEL